MPKEQASALDALGALEQSLPEKLRAYLSYLRVPVRPDYDWQLTPGENGEDYVNPVELNNQITVYGNAQLELGAAMAAINRKRLEQRKRKRAIEAMLKRTDTQVFRDTGMKSTDKNSKALQQAFVEKKLMEMPAQFEAYRTLHDELDTIIDRLDELEVEGDNVDQFIKVVKHASDNAQTHLSFIKEEMRRR